MQFEYYKNILAISNYRQIIQVDSDLIKLENISIYGNALRIIKLSKDEVIIKGSIAEIKIG